MSNNTEKTFHSNLSSQAIPPNQYAGSNPKFPRFLRTSGRVENMYMLISIYVHPGLISKSGNW